MRVGTDCRSPRSLEEPVQPESSDVRGRSTEAGAVRRSDRHLRSSLLITAVALLLPVSALAGFTVSSFKKTSRSSESSDYGAQAALDGNVKTAWVIDPENENPGQWIEVDVPAGKVDKISILVGWLRDADSWVDHARLKEARIEVFDAETSKLVHEQEVELKDIQERQIIDLPDPKVGGEYSGGKVRLTVKSVYEGRDFAHLALGELLMHMVEFDAAGLKLVGTPSSEDDAHDGSNLTDEDTKTFWAATKAGPAEFTLEAGKYSVSSIGISPGPATHGRPKVVEIVQSDVVQKRELPDKPGPHWFELPALVGYTGSGVGPVTVRVLEVYPGSTSSAPAIAEIKMKATVLEAF
jgi:hypothetical protein